MSRYKKLRWSGAFAILSFQKHKNDHARPREDQMFI